jgi:hypothetical protein
VTPGNPPGASPTLRTNTDWLADFMSRLAPTGGGAAKRSGWQEELASC